MNQKLNFATIFPKGSLVLIAILLAFVLGMMFIWLWYDVQLTSLQVAPIRTDSLNIISLKQN